MVNAAYGCAGGYTLAYDPGEINIQNVIHVMEGIHLIESSENSMFAIGIHLIESSENSMFAMYINNYNNAIRNLSCALEKMTLKDLI